MSRYAPVSGSPGDVELADLERELKATSGPRMADSRRRGHERTRHPLLLGGLAAAAFIIFVGWNWRPHRAPPPPPPGVGPPRLPSHLQRGKPVPGPKQLLAAAAPARSYHDALRPDLRYLTLDSWSGWTGQVFTAFSLLYLAHLTQRVAIIPSFRDADHYGDSMITLDTLYDMDKFRRDRGALFVNWDDVKPLDRRHSHTKRDDIGCYMGNNPFEGGRSFDEHNLAQTIWRVDRPGTYPDSVEGFVLWDFDENTRLKETKAFAEREERKLPSNMLDSHLMCYSNLWDMAHAGAQSRHWYWANNFEGLQRTSGGMTDLLAPPARGTHPEWYAIGQYIDFTPLIWDIALSCVKRTFGTKEIPERLLTVHLRRGDFKTWCDSGENCTPAVDRYAEQVNSLLKDAPKGTKVLVTTDEQDDREFLSSIDQLGWYRIDHARLGTAKRLAAEYGDAARWADAAVDQAILSLGAQFVGTSGSQVSIISELRVATWNGGETRMIQRPK